MRHRTCDIVYTSKDNQISHGHCAGGFYFFLKGGDNMGLVSCSRCGRIHEWGKCPIKAPAYKEQRTEVRKFRSSAQWQRKRAQILERDHYLCRMCLSQGIIKQGNEVHHIVKIRANESLKLDDKNLVTLCHACHEFVEHNHQFAIVLKRLVEHPPTLPEKTAP